MSEVSYAPVGQIDLQKHIDETQKRLMKILAEVSDGKSAEEISWAEAKLESQIRRQAEKLSQEVNSSGDRMLAQMIACSLSTTAWVSFLTRKQMLDATKGEPISLNLAEVMDELEVAVEEVIQTGRSTTTVIKG